MREEWQRRGYLGRSGTRSDWWKQGTSVVWIRGTERDWRTWDRSHENRGERPGRKEKPWNCDQSQARGGQGGNRSKQEWNNEGKFRNKLYGPALNTAGILNWETEGDCAEKLFPKLMAWRVSQMISAGRKWVGDENCNSLGSVNAATKIGWTFQGRSSQVLPWFCAERFSMKQTERINPKTDHLACKNLLYTSS